VGFRLVPKSVTLNNPKISHSYSQTQLQLQPLFMAHRVYESAAFVVMKHE